MRNNKNIGILLIIVLFAFSSCTQRKNVRLIGFGYKGDTVSVSDHRQSLKILVNGRTDKNNICSFYQVLKLQKDAKGQKINIRIDSSKTKLLDTLLTIPENYKEPYISVTYPSKETQYQRKVFIGDEVDRNFLKE